MKVPRLWMGVIAITLAGSAVRAAEPLVVYSLISPGSALQPGSTTDVQVAALNRSSSEVTVELPSTLTAAFEAGGIRSSVTLHSNDATPAPSQAIAAGSFALRTYTMAVPRGAATGLGTLEVRLSQQVVTRTALEITAPTIAARGSTAAPTQRPTTTLIRAEPAALALRRLFADRVAPHEPTYFIYGADDPAVKFQLSFKYKLLDFSKVAEQRMERTLHFAFTQRSLWDIKGDSSPFYDTSYMPELMYQSLAPNPGNDGVFNWLGFQAAFKHESNGRDGPLSRSLNIVYARPVFAIGHLNGWHLLAMPEVFTYVTSNEENEAIEDYRGYGRLQLVLGRNDGPSLSATIWAGKDFDHVTTQLDLSLPVRTRLLNFETYFLVQYFNGYGESLLSYREQSETIRGGISFVR